MFPFRWLITNQLTNTGPGMYLAQLSIWLACAKTLAVLNIEKFVDGFGNVVEPHGRYSGGTIR